MPDALCSSTALLGTDVTAGRCHCWCDDGWGQDSLGQELRQALAALVSDLTGRSPD